MAIPTLPAALPEAVDGCTTGAAEATGPAAWDLLPTDNIVSVTVRGVLGDVTLATKAGASLDPEALRTDMHELWHRYVASRLTVTTTPVPGGYALTFDVTPTRRVVRVEFDGMTRADVPQLAMLEGTLHDRGRLARLVASSEATLRNHGYLTFHDSGPLDPDHHLLDPNRMIVVLPDRDIALGTPNIGEPSPKGTWNVWPVGRAGAATIAAALTNPHRRDFAVGTATLGSSPDAAGTELDRVIRMATSEIAPLGMDLAIAVIETPAGGVVVTFDGPDGVAMIERWLARFRRPTAAECTRAVHRIQLATAARTAPLRELLASCPDPTFAAAADSGDRTVHAGERFKCVVR